MESNLHQYQNRLTTLSFVANDMMYYGFYLWRTVKRFKKKKVDTVV